MHQYFAEWYRTANLKPNGDEIPKRWKGIEDFVSTLDVNQVPDTVRLFVGIPVQGPFKAAFSAPLQAADPAFPMRNNELELRVLAGAAIIHALQTAQPSVALPLALGTHAASRPALRGKAINPDTVQASVEYLRAESSSKRTPTVKHDIKPPTLCGEDLLAQPKSVAAQGPPALANALTQPFDQVVAAMTTMTKATEAAFEGYQRALRAVSEECNILWWVFGGVSRDSGEPFCAMPLTRACLVVASELADLTEILPGPNSGAALVEKMLSGSVPAVSNVISLNEAISGVSTEWIKEQNVVGPELCDLCVVLGACRMAVEYQDWPDRLFKATGIDPSKIKLTPVDLAMQFYNERLFQSALEE